MMNLTGGLTGWEAEAIERDRADPLARFASEFHRGPGEIYLDGNSLGLLGKRAEASLLGAVDDWKERSGATLRR